LGAVNPGGLADPLLESAETAIAFHLVLWLPCLPQRSVLAPKARRSKRRSRGNRKCAWRVPSPCAEVSAKKPDCEHPTASKDRAMPTRRFPPPWSVEQHAGRASVSIKEGQLDMPPCERQRKEQEPPPDHFFRTIAEISCGLLLALKLRLVFLAPFL
jgi:hypothetical protein